MSKFRRMKWAMLLWAAFALAQEPALSPLLRDGKVSPDDSVQFEKDLEKSGILKFIFPFDTNGSDRFDQGIQNEFGKKFSKTFEFVDMQDVLVSIANHPDREPWTLYDEPNKRPLIRRWDQATNPATKIGSIVELARAVGDDPAIDFRTRSITAGGDIFVNGKGYYRVSERERDTVLANPFLKSEVVDDPWPPSQTTKTFLVRHQYPSAKNYDHVKDHLSPGLLKDLASAAAKVEDESSDEFKKLTQRILRELTDWAMNSKISPLLRYQTMISIHPFDDYNGRTTRAMFKRQAGYPIFLRYFDQDLFLSYPDLAMAELEGRSELRAIREGLAKMEKANPVFPDYFRTPELWMAAAHVGGKADPGFVSTVTDLFRKQEFINLVRQKQYYDVEQRLQLIFSDKRNETVRCITETISDLSRK